MDWVDVWVDRRKKREICLEGEKASYGCESVKEVFSDRLLFKNHLQCGRGQQILSQSSIYAGNAWSFLYMITRTLLNPSQSDSGQLMYKSRQRNRTAYEHCFQCLGRWVVSTNVVKDEMQMQKGIPARIIQIEKGIFKSHDSRSRPEYQYSFPTPVPDKYAASLPFVPNRRAQKPFPSCAAQHVLANVLQHSPIPYLYSLLKLTKV
jgi:hypothetical protein